MVDISLTHKYDIWSFDHLDTLTVSISDAPRPEEIVVALRLRMGGAHIRGWESGASNNLSSPVGGASGYTLTFINLSGGFNRRH
jgi:Amino acid synthesis